MTDFAGAGQRPGLEIWRIERMAPVPVPAKEVGKFCEGDAYICLKTSQRNGRSALSWDIFFWLGAESSTDEQGAAAYKAVELDELLGGGPVQHREVQGHESERFLQCFASVEYRKGGVDSAFKKVQRGVYETRLLHVKGARAVRVSPVALSAASLNGGDVFLLDEGMRIMQWNGHAANRRERAKALAVATAIKDDERGGKAKLATCEEGAEPEAFWAALGGRAKVAPPMEDDKEPADGGLSCLLQLSDASGAVEVEEVGRGILDRGMLRSDDVFLLDTPGEIFVWVGRGASEAERREGMVRGVRYVGLTGRPAWTRVSKVSEGAEPVLFTANFATWSEGAAPTDLASPRRGSVAAARQQSSSSHLAAQMGGDGGGGAARSLARQASMVDDGSGKVEVWRVENFEPVAVPPERHGQFFSGDSYIVRYSYLQGSKQAHLLYFWLGSSSSADEKGAAALITTRMDDELGGAATQVRVAQGKEPAHLVRLFKGKMVVHSGGKASGFKNRRDVDSYDDDGVSLYHVRGTDALNTRAVQVEETAAALNSGDCFVLLTPGTMFVWRGEGANETEAATATTVAASLQGQRSLEQVAEHAEPVDFWAALGGKAPYASTRALHGAGAEREPRLFHCSNKVGAFEVEEIFDFSQADLEADDVFVLDVHACVFVWVGAEANALERRMAGETAAAYVEAQRYPPDTPVVTVHAGSEPRLFTAHFLGWDAAQTANAFVDPHEARQKQRQQATDSSPFGTSAELTEFRLRLRRTDSDDPGSPWRGGSPGPKPAEEPKPAWANGQANLRKTNSFRSSSGSKDWDATFPKGAPAPAPEPTDAPVATTSPCVLQEAPKTRIAGVFAVQGPVLPGRGRMFKSMLCCTARQRRAPSRSKSAPQLSRPAQSEQPAPQPAQPEQPASPSASASPRKRRSKQKKKTCTAAT